MSRFNPSPVKEWNTINASLADITYNVRQYGGACDGSTDDSAAIQNAINSIPNGSTLLIGNCKVSSALTITNKSIKFKGSNHINGNYTGAYPTSKMYFDNASLSTCITVNGGSIAFEDIVLMGANQVLGVSVTSGSLLLNKAVVQSFQKAFNVSQCYYNKLVDSYVGYCDYDFTFDYCYNINFVNMTIQGNITTLELKNSSNLTVHGGSIEDFSGAGINVNTGSRVTLLGTYFEGTTYQNGSTCVNLLAANTAVIAIGCQVYLTKTEYFITTAVDNIRIYSRGNTFIYPTDTTVVTVYSYPNNLTASMIDISGDNWDTTAGSNVAYCTTGIFSEGAFYEIIYPFNHPNYGKNISTKNNYQSMAKTTPTVPDTTIVNFANAGFGTDDPLGIHTGTWGYNPYRAIYQKGQWEKVGLRLPNQTNTSGATLAQLETELNTLKTNLRAAGVMI